MRLLNPATETFDALDPRSRDMLRKTVQFFEAKGLKKLKADDHERVWYSDFLDFQAKHGIFASLLTPAGYGDADARFDSFRNRHFSEVLGFYGLGYWYTWQVSMLGLGPIWMSENEAIKRRTADLLRKGGIFAFGLSEKQHGADILGSEMRLLLNGNGGGTGEASGRKYYIGNANKAALVSVFAKVDGGREFAFFAAETTHPRYSLIQNVCNSQNYVAEFELDRYPVDASVLLSRGRAAWDASLATVAYCKYNLGWASIGMSTHAFYESIAHAANRRLFGKAVTEFPHIKQYFVDAYARLLAMRLVAARTADYLRAASESDRRYLLYSPIVKMKVTTQGEDVINLLWEVIAAKGFEKAPYFEMAARDIRALPKLEGTAQVNMVLVLKFMRKFLFEPAAYPPLPRMDGTASDDFLFRQGSTTKGQKEVRFHDYNAALASAPLPNVTVFQRQVERLKRLILEAGPDKAQEEDLDFMLVLGELFTLVPYAQLIIEQARLDHLDDDVLDRIFDFMVRDMSAYALRLYSKASASAKQRELCLALIDLPVANDAAYQRVWNDHVLPLNGAYVMNG